MARSRVRGPWLDPRQVPTVPIEIDWTHPLASGLFFLCVPGAPNGFIDLSNIGVPLAPVSGGAQILLPGPNGVGLAAPSPAGGGVVSPAGAGCPAALQFSTSLTIFANGGFLGGSLGSNSNPTIFGVQLGSGAPPYLSYALALTGSGSSAFPTFWVSQSSTTWQNPQLTTASAALPSVSLIGILNTAGASLYGNGIIAGPAAYTGAPYYDSTAQVVIGEAGAVSRSPNFRTDICGIYRRGISNGERAWLDAEPFVMLRPLVRRSYTFQAAGPIVNFTGTVPPRALSGSGLRAAIAIAATLVGQPGAIVPQAPAAAVSTSASIHAPRSAVLGAVTTTASFGETFLGLPAAAPVPPSGQAGSLSVSSALASPAGKNFVAGVAGSIALTNQGISLVAPNATLAVSGALNLITGLTAPLGQFVLGTNVLGDPGQISVSANLAATWGGFPPFSIAGGLLSSSFAPTGAFGISGTPAVVTASASVLAPFGTLASSPQPGFPIAGARLISASPAFVAGLGYSATLITSNDFVSQAPTRAVAVTGTPASTVIDNNLAAPGALVAYSGSPSVVSASQFWIAPTGVLPFSSVVASFSAAFTATSPARKLAASGRGATFSAGFSGPPPAAALAVTGRGAIVSAGGTLLAPSTSATISEYAGTFFAGIPFVTLAPTGRLTIAGTSGLLSTGSAIAPPTGSFAASGFGAALLTSSRFAAPTAALAMVVPSGSLSLGAGFTPAAAALAASGIAPSSIFGVSVALLASSGSAPFTGYSASWVQASVALVPPGALVSSGFAATGFASSSLVLPSFGVLGVSTYGPVFSAPLPVAFTSVELPLENAGREIPTAMLGPKAPDDEGWVRIGMLDWMASLEAPLGIVAAPVAVNVVEFDPAYTVNYVRLVGDDCYLHVLGGTPGGVSVIALQITLSDGSVFQRYVAQQIDEA